MRPELAKALAEMKPVAPPPVRYTTMGEVIDDYQRLRGRHAELELRHDHLRRVAGVVFLCLTSAAEWLAEDVATGVTDADTAGHLAGELRRQAATILAAMVGR
jgi:hypothetical protein